MIVYQANKSAFLDDAFKRDIQEVIFERYTDKTGKKVSRSEIQSWKESLLAVAKVLHDDTIPADCGVAIEYNIPQTGKRIDFILTGKDAACRDNLIIIELKQWSQVKRTDKDAIVVTRFAQGESEVSHPSYQAWSYAALLRSFNEAVYQGDMELLPCAYLHNYQSDDVIDHSFYSEHIRRAPLFLKGEVEKEKLRAFIRQHFKYGDNAALIIRIENGRIRPSKSLVDSLSAMISGKQEFVLIDDQKVVYETALNAAKNSTSKSKNVLIVEGGPGTGKSVVAINLLVSLSAADKVTKYVTKNAAPRAVFESKLTGTIKKTVISNLFTGSGSFTETEKNAFDALVVDEAHRLNEKSGLFGNLGENQIKEIIESSKCSIFFIDEDQRVTFKDIGEKAEIERLALKAGAKVTRLELASQFRCNGSNGYLAWLDDSLAVRDTANKELDQSEFDFRVFDSPQKLREVITEKNKANNKARMVAGYCWDWASKSSPKELDVVIPEFRFGMQWNLSKDGGLWIMAPDSVNEIGCIHTCQGLEVDYIGVIVGDDLIVRNGKIITRPDKRSRQDKSLSGYKRLLKSDPDEAKSRAELIIKNTYRTLMTRGMKGCYVYFTDPETAEYFKSRINVDTRTDGKAVAASMPVNTLPIEVPQTREPFRRLRPEEAKPYENCVPLVDLKFAAGTFSETQTIDPDKVVWVELPDIFRPKQGLFVAQVIGESMNRRIPNGSWCLFKMNPVGSRQGKVVVAQHRDIHDPDFGGAYTVKVYRSEKVATEHDQWRHKGITLAPDSDDPKFDVIALDQSSANKLLVVAELVSVLENQSPS